MIVSLRNWFRTTSVSFQKSLRLKETKNCITNWFKKIEKEKDKKIDEELLLMLPVNEWCVIF